ncbi:serine/threonine-protein kinase ppk6 protein [Colletotrichum tofieldiae]|uniref:Serine/threonine-protein kinase ppk6 protein n=1 Tax=Colletotrichum tofieldiae TaxID=708197 RepID=A0A161W8Z5_9PEZI|nr:serine/threonine-protein kinase ppk6 protein [Colletotrichum tofieldiae]
MSADLLDLDSFYQSPPPQQQQTGGQQGQSQQKQQQRPQQVTASSTDLFDFASFASNRPVAAAPPPVQQTQPWPNFDTQQPSGASGGNNGGWGDFSSFSSGFTSSATTQQQPKQTQQAADDDDGWGDFEVAEPTPTQHSFVMPPQSNKARSSPPPRNRIARASTFDLMTNNLINVVDIPRGSGLSPIPSPGLPSPNRQPAPSPGLSWQQPSRQPDPGLSWQTASSKQPVSPGLSFQTSSAKPQPSPGFSSQVYGSQKKPSPKPAKQSDPNILFDAEDFELQGGNDDEEEDDEFGDFETVQTPFPGANMSPTLDPRPAQRQPPQAPQPPPSMDLLSLDDDPFPVPQPPPQPSSKKPQLSSLNLTAPTSPYPQAPKSPSFHERNPFPGLGLTTPTSGDFKKEEKKKDDQPNSPTPVTAWPSFGQTSPKKPSTAATKKSSTTTNPQKAQEEEDWPDFEDFPDDEPSAVDSANPPGSWDWDAVDGVKPAHPSPVTTKKPGPKPKAKPEPAPKVSDDSPPPINIPPPSVLLSIFPQLLDLANSSLFKPTGQMAAPIKKRILSDPGTVTFLRAYLLLATVAARVIAGRKLRWHRDKFLAQGMAISAAGAKGMKLAGVDKAQAAREDREAADVVGVWREHVGRLRSAVAAANSTVKSPRDQLRVPEINETIPVSTAKVVPTAPKPCVICGLKREERVSKVDFDVEDSFGEWWVEHWGHRACKNFWAEHEKQLRQR